MFKVVFQKKVSFRSKLGTLSSHALCQGPTAEQQRRLGDAAPASQLSPANAP